MSPPAVLPAKTNETSMDFGQNCQKSTAGQHLLLLLKGSCPEPNLPSPEIFDCCLLGSFSASPDTAPLGFGGECQSPVS